MCRSNAIRTSWGGKRRLSKSRNKCNIKRDHFPAHYWVALHQKKAVQAKKEYKSKIKLQDACSHHQEQLEKNATVDQQDRTVQAMIKIGYLQASFREEFVAR